MIVVVCSLLLQLCASLGIPPSPPSLEFNETLDSSVPYVYPYPSLSLISTSPQQSVHPSTDAHLPFPSLSDLYIRIGTWGTRPAYLDWTYFHPAIPPMTEKEAQQLSSDYTLLSLRTRHSFPAVSGIIAERSSAVPGIRRSTRVAVYIGGRATWPSHLPKELVLDLLEKQMGVGVGAAVRRGQWGQVAVGRGKFFVFDGEGKGVGRVLGEMSVEVGG